MLVFVITGKVKFGKYIKIHIKLKIYQVYIAGVHAKSSYKFFISAIFKVWNFIFGKQFIALYRVIHECEKVKYFVH